MEIALANVRLAEEGVACPGCGRPIAPGTEAWRWSQLPSVLRTSLMGVTYHSGECARNDARNRYHEMTRLQSTNPAQWETHAASNSERLLTLKLVYEWAEHHMRSFPESPPSE